MRYGILADVHANLDALGAVLGALEGEHVDRVVGLGDFVGYYASPNECLDQLRDLQMEAVAGNHDLVAVGRAGTDRFSHRAREAILWTQRRLGAANRAYLASLPERAVVDGLFAICHGSLRSAHEYVRTPADVTALLADCRSAYPGVRVCFFGQTHQAVVYRWSGEGLAEAQAVREGEVSLTDGAVYAVNPGSVGQPRDGDRRASFAVFDAADRTLRIRRVDYDYEAHRHRTLLAGLPPDGPHRPRLVRRVMRLVARARAR